MFAAIGGMVVPVPSSLARSTWNREVIDDRAGTKKQSS